MLTYSLYLCMC
uniref:Uncharacterized protein n=1 Tax=Rhizophora mucronata TaxID=61149 RepID=A0A2P2QAF8_RHIMU